MDFRVCCVKGCDEPSLALGLCTLHWQRTRKYGSPAATKFHSGSFRGKPAAERFEMQVKRREDGCWIWAGGVDLDGYGAFKGEAAGQQFLRAHRWSWAHHNNKRVPPGAHICHTCDNPRCVNPEHLFLGDPLANMRDKVAKGRLRVADGEKNGHAKLTEAQARAILADPRPHAAIAADYGVKSSTVGSIKQRVSWQHIEDVVVAQPPPRVSHRQGVSDRITPDIVRAIRNAAEPLKALAERHGVSVQTVCDIRKRRSWAHIE